jgi:adenylate kinase family enzyme
VTPPRRLLIVGAGGAGKSTLARRVGERLGLPVIHLDAHYWRAGWVETPPDEWTAAVDRLAAGERWVMDGNYGGTLDRRLARADTVVFLDAPRLTSLWRVVKRWLRHRGRTRPDVAPGCPEQLSWEFVRWIWTYPRRRRGEMLAKLDAVRTTKRVHVLRTARDVDAFVAGLGG